jgi:hypothetical protein
MKNRTYFLLAFLPAFALTAGKISAESKKAKSFPYSDGQKPHVIQMDPDFPIEQLKSDGIETHSLKNIQSTQEVLPPYLQSKLLREAKLDSYVKDWSGFEKDRFCLRVEYQKPEEVVSRYDGKIPLEPIAKLKNLISQYRADKNK